MKKFDWRDFWVRCGKTFLEAALGYITAAFTGVQFGDGSLSDKVFIGILVTGLCTGFTAVINGIVIPLLKTDKKEPEAISECEEQPEE